MLSYKIWLQEKRRNPEQNPKVSSYDHLIPYLKEDYYISMRNINKLGINPKSGYNTPNGIYGYHLGVYKDRIEQKQSLETSLPYVGDAPYVYVFKSKIKPIKLGDMTEESVKKFIKETFDKKPEMKIFFLENVDFLKSLERAIKVLKKDYSVQIKEPNGEYDFNEEDVQILKQDYSVVFDVKPKKYTGEEFVKLMADTIKKIEIELRELKGNLNNPKYLIDKIYEKGKQEALIKSPGGIFWWFSWFVFEEKINKWSGFFRDMGIYGIDDSKGESIIHPNEPFQTVFFDKTKLEIVKVFDNKDYLRHKREQKQNEEGYVYVDSKSFKFVTNDNIRYYKNIDIYGMKLKNLPDFGNGKDYVVTGIFDCSANQLTSLKGSPIRANRFICTDNKKEFTEEEVREVCDVATMILT